MDHMRKYLITKKQANKLYARLISSQKYDYIHGEPSKRVMGRYIIQFGKPVEYTVYMNNEKGLIHTIIKYQDGTPIAQYFSEGMWEELQEHYK
jgi:hypothetical protein